MPFFNKSYRTGTLEHIIGRHGNGNILQGEADMFKRIQVDCEKSNLNWYVWYDLSLPIPYAGQSEIQIDFLLICEKGAIVLEVKGGNIQLISGRYYYSSNGGALTQMKTSPFDQANNYKWALLNHNILNSDQLFVSYAVAFPHQAMEYTNKNEQIDKSFWLWEKNAHDDDNSSFADFCEDILDYTRDNSSKKNYIDILSNEELKSIVEILSPTIEDKSHYSKSSLNEVLEWLKIENLDILEALSRNKRIIIEGGPGTGKTTMAKAFIKQNKGLKGLYLCHNVLLQAKVKEELIQEDLYNCEVITFGRFLSALDSANDGKVIYDTEAVYKILSNETHEYYDYIIIDEAQDIADLGVNHILNMLLSNCEKGLATGRYLIFYDLEQGYNRNFRKIDDIISDIMTYAVHYKLNENKRVVTNKEIVRIASNLLDIESAEQYKKHIKELCELDCPYFKIASVDSSKQLSKYFRSVVKDSTDCKNTVVLVHSSLKHLISQTDSSMTVYDSLECKPFVHILDEDDIVNPDNSTVPYTSILKYKGLETHKVILVITNDIIVGDLDNFIYETYIGFTRAIMELQVIVYSPQ